MIFSSLNISSIRSGDVFMRRYTSSRAKRKLFHCESEFQIFLLISSRHIGVAPRYTNMASPYKAL